MALVKGINVGFITTAPTVDPEGNNTLIDTRAHAFKDTAPTGATKVTEIGWYCDNATEAANFEVGIYDHNAGDDNPEAKVGNFSTTNAKGTDAGWKTATGLNIPITEETIYWIAVQLDDTATSTFANKSDDAGERQDFKSNQTSLPEPWGSSSNQDTILEGLYAITDAPGAISPIFKILKIQNKNITLKRQKGG